MTATASEDWCKTLQRGRLGGLNKGDIVYERVSWGHGPDNVKYNRAKVIDTNRSAVRVRFDDGRETMMAYTGVWHEPAEPEPKPRPVRMASDSPPEPVPLAKPVVTARHNDDEYTAWLTMGRDMLATIDRNRQTLDGELRDLETQIEAVDASHRHRIEQLEAELIEEKREHQDARAFAASRRESVTAKLASLNERRAAMAALMGEK